MARVSYRAAFVAVGLGIAFSAACGFTGLGTAVLVDPDAADSESGAKLPSRDGMAPIDLEGGFDDDATAGDGAVAGDAADASATDALADADAGCPTSICTGGCAGTTCIIANPPGNVTCPTGRPCRVQCASCDSATITCGDGPCTIVCTGDDGCNSVTINAAAASSLCLQCTGNPGCNGLTCNNLPACQKRCATCNSIGNCGSCANVASCP